MEEVAETRRLLLGWARRYGAIAKRTEQGEVTTGRSQAFSRGHDLEAVDFIASGDAYSAYGRRAARRPGGLWCGRGL